MGSKQWRLVFTWPNLTLLEIDGDTTVMIECNSSLLQLLSHLKNGDTLTFDVNV